MMRKNITVFFAFTLCFAMNSFAGFKEAAELYEQQQYKEAYDDFLVSYQNNDLRGNAYLRNLILTSKIDAERKLFWTLEELQKLEDTTSLNSENFLKASELYQLFLKDNIKFIVANTNKRKKIEKRLKVIIENLMNLYDESNTRASMILAQLSEDMDLRKRFSLSQPRIYYTNSLQFADRDIYLIALQKEYLNNEGYATHKLYAQFLERFPKNGEGELKIANMCKSKKDPVAESRWLIRAAHLGNQEAFDRVLKDYLFLITDLNPADGRNPLRDNDILVCVYKAAYELKDGGAYALLMGNFFDNNQKDEMHKVNVLKKDNKKSLYWYNKAKNVENYLGMTNCLVLQYNEIRKKLISENEAMIQQHINFVEDVLKIEDDFSEFNTNEMRVDLSHMVITIIQKLFKISDLKQEIFSRSLDYVIHHGKLYDKNIAKFFKFLFIQDGFILGQVNDEELLLLLKESSETYCHAANKLGFIYDQELNFKKSFECYLKACAMANTQNPNHYLCFYNLALTYANGRGCKKDYKKAYDLLKIAYSLKPFDSDIVDSLAKCCFYLGGEFNKEAYHFYELATKMKVPFADFNLALCKLFGKGCKKNVAAAQKIFEIYYATENSNAAFFLGMIELIKTSELNIENAKKYFEQVVLWANSNLDTNQNYLDTAKLFLASVSKEKNTDEIPFEPSAALVDGIEDVAEKKEDSDSEEFVFDYQTIIEEERQKSLGKRVLKNRQQVDGQLEEENIISYSLSKLKPKQKQIFNAIMDPSVNQEVKWSQFEKLICGLMKKGDFLKPAGGSKINIKLGQVQKQIHKPDHNDAAPLCPGRIQSARELLSAVVLEEQPNSN
jgi:TPR repeat protein